MKVFFKFIVIGLVISVSLISCDEDSIVGSDLLGGEGLEIEFTDTIGVSIITEIGEPIIAYRPGTQISTFLLGEIDEPIFGKAKSNIVCQASRGGSSPDFAGSTLDSAVLILKLDTLGLYGDQQASHNIKVYQLETELLRDDTIYSNDVIDFNPSEIGSRSFSSINAFDSIEVNDHKGDSLRLTYPQLRIPLDMSFATSLFENADANSNDTTFLQTLKGMYLTDETDNSMLGIRLGGDRDTLSRVSMFYTDNEGVKRKFSYNINFAISSDDYSGNIRANVFEMDLTGSVVESALDDPLYADSLFYIQSMDGVRAKIDMTGVLARPDDLLNYAELEFTLAELMDDNLEENPPITNLLASFINEDGKLEVINDIALDIGLSFFDGSLQEIDENGLVTTKYRMNITNYVKALRNDPTYLSNLYITGFSPIQTAKRSVIYGPGHSTYPVRLKLAFTKP